MANPTAKPQDYRKQRGAVAFPILPTLAGVGIAYLGYKWWSGRGDSPPVPPPPDDPIIPDDPIDEPPQPDPKPGDDDPKPVIPVGYTPKLSAEKAAAKKYANLHKAGSAPTSVIVAGKTYDRQGSDETSIVNWLANLGYWDVYVPPGPGKIPKGDPHADAWKRIRALVKQGLGAAAPGYDIFGDSGSAEAPNEDWQTKSSSNCSWVTVGKKWWGQSWKPYVQDQIAELTTDLGGKPSAELVAAGGMENFFPLCAVPSATGTPLMNELRARAKAWGAK